MTAVIDGQLSIFDWMEDFDPAKETKQAAGFPEQIEEPEVGEWVYTLATAKEAKQAAGLPEQIEEPEVGEWVYTRGAPISRVMRRSYIGKKVLMDKSTSSKECYKVGILEDVITGQYWNGKEYAPCEMSIVRDETKQRNQINHTLNNQIFECLPWHSYKEREDSILLGPVRHPCERRCKVEWGSKTCFERRGQIWNWNDHKWVRDENGQPVIGKRTCDWEPGEGQ